jgi:hypothetical protein
MKTKLLLPIDYLSWSLKNIGKEGKKCEFASQGELEKKK